ncbi:hypothetical protein O9C21_27960, partial [Klebsiella pneumoniae]
RREVSALTDARKTLAYDFFRILRAPLSDKLGLRKYLLWIITGMGNDSNLLIVFYVQIMPDDFVMQLHR